MTARLAKIPPRTLRSSTSICQLVDVKQYPRRTGRMMGVLSCRGNLDALRILLGH